MLNKKIRKYNSLIILQIFSRPELKFFSALSIFTVLLILSTVNFTSAATKTFNGPGNFSNASLWGGSLPGAGDALRINGTCTFDNAASNLAYGTIDIGRSSAGTINWPSGGTNTLNVTTISSSTTGSAIDMTNGGVLQIRNIWTFTNQTFTAGSGTVNYSGAAQTVVGLTYNNLTLSGSGTKTVAGVTVNGILSIEGSATVSVAPTYGSTATLLYNTTIARTAGFEWITPFAATGGIVIANTGVITTGAVKTLNANVPLLINSGATLSTGATNTWTLTVGGTTTVFGILTLSNTGAKTFTGAVTINTGGAITETAAAPLSFGSDVTISGTLTEFGAAVIGIAGSLLNNGTYSASTGVHTFSGASKTIGGSSTNTIPSVTVTGTITNNGTLTINTALAGATGFLTNTGTLNLGGTCSIGSTSGGLSNSGTINRSGSGTTTTLLTGFTNTGTINISGSGTITGITNNAAGIVNHSGSSTITSFNNATSTSTLNISTTPTVPTFTTLTTTTAGNTVNYNGAGAQTVKDQNYGGNLIISGTGTKTWTEGGARTVTGNLTIGDGTTLSVAGAFAFTVTGTTTIGAGTSGTLSITNVTGTKTFTGSVTINTGGVLSETVAAQLAFGSDVTISGSLTESGAAVVGIAGSLLNNGTYTASSGDHTFSGTTKTIGGSATNIIPNATFTGAYTNSGTLSVSTLLTVTLVTLTNNGTITATTALSGSGGVTQGTTGILNIGGSSGITTLTANANGNTVNYNGAAQTIKTTTYSNLTFSGSGGKTFPTGTTTVNGILSIENGSNANTFTGSLSYGTSATLQYNTTSARTSSNEWITPFTATGGVIIANTGAITLNSAKVLGLNAPLIINSGATLNTSAANNYALTFGGNYSNNGGTLTANGSSIVIDNTMGTQTFAGFTTAGEVSMTKTGGTATLTGNVNGGAFTINGSGGTLNLGTGLTHTFTGTWTRTAGTLDCGSSILKIGGSVSGSGGTFTAGTGTVEWNGAGAQTIAPLTYNNLITSTGGIKTIDADITANGTVTINSGTVLSINPAKSLTVLGSISNPVGPSGLLIKSDVNGTGNLIHNNSGVQGTVQRYLIGHTTNKPIHYISTPLTNGTIDSFWRSGDYNIYWYDETNQSTTLNTGWTRIFGAGAALTIGRGYSVVSQYSSRTNSYPGTLTVPGNLTGQTIPVTYTTSTTPTPAVEGWNLIGNPYPCALNATTFLTDNSTSLDPSYAAIYYWNDVDGSRLNQDYATRNLSGGVAAAAGVIPNDRVSVGQGFFVKVKSGTTSLSFASGQRTTNSSSQFFIIDPLLIQRLRLSVYGPNDLYNELLLGFVDGATSGIDPGYDAIKLRGNADIALYSIIDGDSLTKAGYPNEFAIQALPPVTRDTQVNLGFFASTTGTYTFRMKALENFDPDVDIYLKDLVTDTITDLRKDSMYHLNISPGEYKTRFILQFHNNSPVGITKKEPLKTVDIYSADGKIYISGDVKVNDQVTITDLTGRVVGSYKINPGRINEINNENLTGIYFVSVSTSHGLITKKLVCTLSR